MSNTNASSADIERDLDETRARLNRNLNTLEDRVSPNQLIEQAINYLRTGQGAAFTRNLGASVRDNPLPAAITGIGLAWLMASGGRSSGAYGPRTDYLHERAHQAGLAVTRLSHDTDETHRDRMDDARGAVLGVRRKASETADAYGGRIQDAMATAREWVAGSAAQLHDSASTMGDQMGRQLHDTRNRLQGAQGSIGDSMGAWTDKASGTASQVMSQGRRRSGELAGALTDNPLLLGALGVTAGAVLGILLPESQTEHQYLGDAGERVRGTVADTARDAVHRGQAAVQAGVDAGRQSAKDAGLAPDQTAGDLTAKAREVAETALSAGKDAAQNP